MRSLKLARWTGLLVVLVLSGCNLSLAQDVTPPPGYVPPDLPQPLTSLEGVFPAAAPDPQVGAEIYTVRCMPCHGDTGRGDGPQSTLLPVSPPAIGSPEVAAASSPAQWFAIITNGNLDNFMPPFASALSEQERWDVLAYIYSLGQTPEQVQAGEVVFAAACSDCHTAAEFATAEHTVQASNADWLAIIQDGIPQQMPAYQDELTGDELTAVVAFLRAQVFPPFSHQLAAPLDTATPEVATTDTPEVTADATETALVEESPAAPAGLRVAGQVQNETSGQPVGGAPVTLYGYDHTTQVLVLTTVTDADGGFEFAGLDDVPQRLFFVTADHMGMTYGSEFVQVTEASEPDFALEVAVYDTTTDASELRIARLHVFLEFPEPELVQVVELLVLSNASRYTVIPEVPGGSAYQVALPADASGLIFQEGALGARFIATTEGFGDTQPVLPGEGETQLLFAYQLPYERGLEFTLPLMMDVDTLLVFIPPDSVRLASDRLTDGGLQDLNGLPYQLYAGDGFAAGESLRLDLSGRHPLAAGGFQLSESNPTSLILGALGLVFTLVGLGLWWRERRGELIEEIEDDADSLLDEILELEAAYERGEMNEATFSRRRVALKARLAEIVGE